MNQLYQNQGEKAQIDPTILKLIQEHTEVRKLYREKKSASAQQQRQENSNDNSIEREQNQYYQEREQKLVNFEQYLQTKKYQPNEDEQFERACLQVKYSKKPCFYQKIDLFQIGTSNSVFINKKLKAKFKLQLQQLKNEYTKSLKKARTKKMLLKYLVAASMHKMTVKDLLNFNPLKRASYKREGSFWFLKMIKYGKIEEIKEKLNNDRYLAYDMNELQQSALHIACKCGWKDIIELLLSYHVFIDSQDMMGKTALYYAAKHQDIEICKMLFYYGASPWCMKNCNYNKLDLSPDLFALFKTAKKLQMGISLASCSKREEIFLAQRDQLFK